MSPDEQNPPAPESNPEPPTSPEAPSPTPEANPPPKVDLAPDAPATAQPLPLPGGPGSQPAPFDPHQAPIWQGLLAEFEREIGTTGDLPAAAPLIYESGRIWEEKLAQPRNAWQCYNKAFQLDPHLLANIRSARRLASQVGNWNVAVQIIDSEIEACLEPRTKAHLQHGRGLILEEKLGKLDEARAAYEQALATAPDEIEFLRQVERLSITTGDWPRVVEVRDRLAGLVQDKRVVVQLLLGTARIREIQLGTPEKAEELYRRVLEMEPDNLQALRALRLLYTEARRWDSLLDILMREAELTPDPDMAALLYYRAARLLREQLGDEERALGALQKALGLTPDNHMVLNEMAQISANLMRWQELVEIYGRQAQVIRDRQELVALYFKLGGIWEEKLFDEDRAIPCYRKVVELNPNYLPALQALGKLFYRKGQWEELVEMYEIEIRETPDPKQRAIRLYKLAEILEDRLSRDEEATQKYEQVLELSPGYLPALKALGRLYTKYNRWESLIGMHEAELATAQDHDQQVFLLDKIGSLWEDKLNNVDKATDTYQRILELAPNYLPAIRTLGKLHVRADRWLDLIRINEMEAQLVNDQKQVISLLHRNGEIYEEKLNDKDQAIEVYKQVLALSPAFLPALQNLGRLYFIKGRWDDLISMYRQEIEVTLNEAQQITLLYKIGELYEEKLVQEDKAIIAYQEVLRIQQSNFPALKALIRIYTGKRDWESLLDTLEKEAAVLEDPNQKALSLYKVAELWEVQLGNPDKATETLQRILVFHPDHGPTLQLLIRLYTLSQNWRELLGLYDRELQSASGEGRRLDILFRMADLYAHRVNDLVRAAECYEKVLSIQSDHLLAVEALERLYLSQRNYGALARVYERAAALVGDTALRVALQSQAADLKENRLQPPQNAGDNYLQMLNLWPDHPEATRAIDILYHKYGTWHGLRALYERQLTRSPSAEEALDLCMRIGDLAETRLRQPQVAIHYFRQALALAPDYLPAIKALKRLYTGDENAEAMLELLDREGRVTRDPRQAVAILLQAGALYRDRFQNPARAVECFFQVLERDPRENQGFAQLEALLTTLQDWERLVVLYQNRVGVTEDSRAVLELHLKLGALMRERLSRPLDAATHLREVLRINPSQQQALSVLAEITFEQESWDESVTLTNRLLELTTDPTLQLAGHFRLGVIYQEKKPELDRAVQHFRKMLELNPSQVPTLQRLKAIYLARQQWADAMGVLDGLVAADPENQVAHLMEQAHVLEVGMSDPLRAVEVYSRLQALAPDDLAVVSKLGELYERLERWSDLVDSYHAFIGLLPPDRAPEAIPLHLAIGKLYDEKLSNTDKAILEYKRVVELNPRHLEAHVELAGLYGRTGLYYANAVEEHRKLLEINPFRLASYHELRRVFEEQRAFDKVYCVCAVLHYLRSADQNEEFFYAENSAKVPEKTGERLTADEFERLLVHPDERGLLRTILRIVGLELNKAYPGDLARHGVGKGDRTRSDDPMRALSDSLLANFGEAEYELYRSNQPSFAVNIENTDPPALVVGEGLVKRTVVREQRFAAARALKRVVDGSFLASALGPRELAKLLAALLQPLLPNCPLVTYPAELPDDLARRVQKALPRKARKQLEELVRDQGPAFTRVPDYEAYLRGAEHSANRLGLALSNDLPNAINHLSREIPELRDKRFGTSDEMTAALSRHATVCELLRFAVSEEYFALRARLKLSILN